MPKERKNLWDNSSIKTSVHHFQSKEEKDLLKKVDDINYKIIELHCEVDCLLEKKKYFLSKIQQFR
tara:strand:+ start:946 stop:1143 length:198 start_codon:yes stop_codon:yes gene_type:complete